MKTSQNFNSSWILKPLHKILSLQNDKEQHTNKYKRNQKLFLKPVNTTKTSSSMSSTSDEAKLSVGFTPFKMLISSLKIKISEQIITNKLKDKWK